MPDLSKRSERYATATVAVVVAAAVCYFGLGLRITSSSEHSAARAVPAGRVVPQVVTAPPTGAAGTTAAGAMSCASFPDREAAQIYWNAHRAAYPSWDGNHNGIACEQLKSVTSTSPSAPPTSDSPAASAATVTKIIQRNVAVTKTEPAAPPVANAPAPAAKPTAPSKATILASRTLFGLDTATPDQATSLESTLARHTQIDGYFQGWDTGFRANNVNAAWAAGELPFLTWESRPLSGGSTSVDYSLMNIADGDFDAYLTSYAKAIVANGLPLMIRFDQEMNGNWYRWAEQDPDYSNPKGSYIAAWRHIYDVFQSVGANNLVIWDWSPNRIDNIGPLPSIDNYYPGDAYVDLVGMTGYYRYGSTSPTFATTYDATLTALRTLAPSKPIILSEVGATESGGNKVAFVNSFFAGLTQNPDIIGFAWFDYTVTSAGVTNDWRIESTPAVTAAFRTGLYSSGFGLPTGRHQVWGAPASGGTPTGSSSPPAPAPSTTAPVTTPSTSPAASSPAPSSPEPATTPVTDSSTGPAA